MLQYDIYRQVKPNETEDSVIYQEGKSADYFVMILEGRVTVKVGIEQLEFESGPFTCFGTHALIREMGTGDAQTATPSGIPSTPTANRLRVGSLGTVSDAIGFCPDYTVVASTELSYLTINRELYAAGRNATQIERSRQRAKMRGEGASVSFPSSPMLPRDDRFSALYLANSTESLATAHERRDSKRITFKDGEFFFLHW
ncbi:metal transporter CNNM4-like [Diaphorina citri]|uniref:Metal transporter CNNM4-like n=1 Tax=Diaphorina citri TaxID=121845 RepID=A0A3Q0IV56_DIACI|nr:metal transporter CNNM4-like [Diaphorina citri]